METLDQVVAVNENENAVDKKVTIKVPNKGTVKTIDAEVLDIANLFSIGAKNGWTSPTFVDVS